MAKRTIKINLKLPTGVFATAELEAKATQAAEEAIASSVQELAEAQKLANELASKGIQITATELLSRKTPNKYSELRTSTSYATQSTTRKRVVLDHTQKAALIEDLRAGEKVAAAAHKYNVSTATVMNIKGAAGLTKIRTK
ncbi:MAG: hypothetical protein ACI81V_001340 [Lentimonas sp.]|jgi:hypothetical protein